MRESERPHNKINLSGYNSVVTGGAQGLGLAIAKRLIQSGASVCIWDLDEEKVGVAVTSLAKLISSEQVVIGMVTNVTHESSVVEVFAETIGKLGRIDIVINNAGISGPNTPTWNYTLENWLNVINVNLTGTFLVTRAALPTMIEHNYGRIVNVASVAGKEGNPNASAYSSSKAGIIGLTKTLGKELANTGITVNCVTPSAVKTAIFNQMSREHIEFMLSKIPMGRFGLPEEIAAMVTWLSSPECSFSTGATFDISGGRATY